MAERPPSSSDLAALKPGDWIRVSHSVVIVESAPFDYYGVPHVRTSGGTFNVRGIDEIRKAAA